MQLNFFASSKSTMTAVVLMVATLPQFSPARGTASGAHVPAQDQADMQKLHKAIGFVGAGVTLTPIWISDNCVRGTAVASASPAQDAGMKVGDKIDFIADRPFDDEWWTNRVVFDHQEAIYWTLPEVEAALLGAPGSILMLGHPGWQENAEVKRAV